jgi:hypothetical protein
LSPLSVEWLYYGVTQFSTPAYCTDIVENHNRVAAKRG